MKRAVVFGLTAFAVLVLLVFSLALHSERAAYSRVSMPPQASAPADDRAERDEGFGMADELKEEAPSKKMRMKPQSAKGMAAGLGGLVGSGVGGGGRGGDLNLAMPSAMPAAPAAEAERSEDGAAAPAENTRAWFPETFLFEPLVVTDAQGKAAVPVKVPDRLTNWRVLGLAHSRAGGQTGAVTSFLGTLPTYVDAVTPAFLYAGDEVKLPIQVVNTTEASVHTPLTISATGGKISVTTADVTVPAFGNVLRYSALRADVPGLASVKATLSGSDSVERTIPIKPAGTPVAVTRGGTLAAPRELIVEGWSDALPGSEEVRVLVYPGALGLLRSELSAAPGRGGAADDAYLLSLLGKAPTLLKALGADVEKDVLRELTLLATQRAVRHARTPAVEVATLLAPAALAHPENPVLSRMGERLAQLVAQAQRPDGTCQGANGWTLQRLLVTTGECVRAVRAGGESATARQRSSAVQLKASGAFERQLGRINDPYTAAAALASGAVQGESAKKLKELLVSKLEKTKDGAQFVPVDPSMQRPDGLMPSTYEATALAVLALLRDDKAPVADLGAYLLGGYSAAAGWGDGRTNLVAIDAVSAIFKDPVPAEVSLSLARDGVVVAQGAFDAAKLRQVVTLSGDAKASGGQHTWTLTAQPAVPGLGFSFALAAHVPWKPSSEASGLELTQASMPQLSVGQTAELSFTIATPANLMTSLKVGLPAGVQPDSAALNAMVSSGAIHRFESEDGLVTLHLGPSKAGASRTLALKVIPTLGGTLHAPPVVLAPEGRPSDGRTFAPQLWVVR